MKKNYIPPLSELVETSVGGVICASSTEELLSIDIAAFTYEDVSSTIW